MEKFSICLNILFLFCSEGIDCTVIWESRHLQYRFFESPCPRSWKNDAWGEVPTAGRGRCQWLRCWMGVRGARRDVRRTNGVFRQPQGVDGLISAHDLCCGARTNVYDRRHGLTIKIVCTFQRSLLNCTWFQVGSQLSWIVWTSSTVVRRWFSRSFWLVRCIFCWWTVDGYRLDCLRDWHFF